MQFSHPVVVPDGSGAPVLELTLESGVVGVRVLVGGAAFVDEDAFRDAVTELLDG